MRAPRLERTGALHLAAFPWSGLGGYFQEENPKPAAKTRAKGETPSPAKQGWGTLVPRRYEICALHLANPRLGETSHAVRGTDPPAAGSRRRGVPGQAATQAQAHALADLRAPRGAARRLQPSLECHGDAPVPPMLSWYPSGSWNAISRARGSQSDPAALGQAKVTFTRDQRPRCPLERASPALPTYKQRRKIQENSGKRRRWVQIATRPTPLSSDR
jgi:hypothetical protein